MIPQPPISNLTNTLFPYTTLFRSKREGIGQCDLQLFTDGDRYIGREHHAAIGNIADPPQTRVAIAYHLGDPPDRAIAIAVAALGAGGDVLLLNRLREATLVHLIHLIESASDRTPRVGKATCRERVC